MADVFVSYSRRDKARVMPLVEAITAAGWSVWWDPEIAPGQEFDRLIDTELAAAGAVLVVWSKDSVTSRWVRGEAREAADRGILVPVRFDAATLPIDARVLHTIDLDEPVRAGSPQVLEVVRALAEHIAHPPLPAPQAAPGAMPEAGRQRIAICVLPFANVGGDPDQQFLSDGISEDIITEMSRWHMLAVRSRAASFRYRGAEVDPAQVARELRVRFVVEGSVRRMGERMRITIQLIDTESGTQVWAEKFDRATAELFEVQDQVVKTIVSTLVGRVQASDIRRARGKATTSLAAYECVLKGNALAWDQPAERAEATRLFEQAIAIDPGYGLAHTLLAVMRYSEWYGAPIGEDALLDEAYALALHGVAIDPDESTCHSILAQVHHLRREFDLSLQHIHRAIELNPSNQWNNADMGMILVYAGQSEEALAWFERAREIDPYFEEPWYWREYGLACFLVQRFEDAVQNFSRSPSREHLVAPLRAAALAMCGDLAGARACADACLASRPGFSIRFLLAKKPFRREADVTLLTEGLRKAGFPD